MHGYSTLPCFPSSETTIEAIVIQRLLRIPDGRRCRPLFVQFLGPLLALREPGRRQGGEVSISPEFRFRLGSGTAVLSAALLGVRDGWFSVGQAGLLVLLVAVMISVVRLRLITKDRRTLPSTGGPRRRASDGFLRFVLSVPGVPLALDIAILAIRETRPRLL